MKFNINTQMLRDLNPCKDPNHFGIKDGWSGTLLDVLDMEQIKSEDKIWAISRLLDDKTARLFAVFCARESLVNVKDDKIKQVLINTLEVAERFANNKATETELSAAWSAAAESARSAAADAAAAAAWSAVAAAARSAARSAVAAAAAVVAVAAESARSAARSKQIEQLKKMIREVQGFDIHLLVQTANTSIENLSKISSDTLIITFKGAMPHFIIKQRNKTLQLQSYQVIIDSSVVKFGCKVFPTDNLKQRLVRLIAGASEDGDMRATRQGISYQGHSLTWENAELLLKELAEFTK